MVFNSFAFIGCFIVLLAMIWVVCIAKAKVEVRNFLLLLASYAFYWQFNPGFLLILIFVSAVCFLTGNALLRGIRHPKTWLGIGITLSLLPLLFFKYAFFLLDNTSRFLSLELNVEWVQGLLLPVGISFFTFQALTYPLDIYRKKITVRSSLLDFLLFTAFFPTVLSGPIEKARNLLPQFRLFIPLKAEWVGQGASIFIWGVFKKVVVADRLASYVDWVYGSIPFQGSVTLAFAAILYSIQIYCDFSGYSDMALGIAKAMGFDITKNFRQPYFSRTIKAFWRKWHIALTSWFTEYVYFSLGGNRVRLKARWVFNISMVFILSGIWHGAAWNFLIWGALHCLFYLAEYFAGIQKETVKWNRISSFLSGIWTFSLVTLAWIFFRVPTFADAIDVIAGIWRFDGQPLATGASAFTFACTMAMLVLLFVYELMVRCRLLCYEAEGYDSSLRSNLLLSLPLLFAIALFGLGSDNFVYFQF